MVARISWKWSRLCILVENYSVETIVPSDNSKNRLIIIISAKRSKSSSAGRSIPATNIIFSSMEIYAVQYNSRRWSLLTSVIGNINLMLCGSVYSQIFTPVYTTCDVFMLRCFCALEVVALVPLLQY